jgi:hypothetical protein
MKVSDLKQDQRNANKGTKRGREAVAKSLKQFGAGRSILLDRDGNIIAGNKTVESASSAGIDNVIVVQTDGSQLVAVQRTDLSLDSPKARELAIADNRTSEIGLEWDKNVLAEMVSAGDMELEPFFTGDELAEVLEQDIARTSDNVEREATSGQYTAKIVTPVYAPKGESPQVADLLDADKASKLADRIRAADIPEDVRAFLIHAAARHVVYDYHNIAEFYCHASPEIQDLMEESALVIIDFDKAIEQGYVELTGELMTIYSESYA